jgi:CHRD domain
MRRALLFAALIAVALVAYGDDGGRKFIVQMTGAAEAPGPGDEDGSGVAILRLNPGTGQVCFTIFVEDITLPATAAHIHEAPPGEPGPVVIGLGAPDENGIASGCVSADRDEILEIIREPEEYYVNVHNSDFPAGAVRGQLAR